MANFTGTNSDEDHHSNFRSSDSDRTAEPAVRMSGFHRRRAATTPSMLAAATTHPRRRRNDLLFGGDGDDLSSVAAAPTLPSRAGNDPVHLESGRGSDSVDGGDGFDTLEFTAPPRREHHHLGNGEQATLFLISARSPCTSTVSSVSSSPFGRRRQHHCQRSDRHQRETGRH